MTLSQTTQLVILLMCLASLHAAPIPEDNGGTDESNTAAKAILTENEKKVLNLEKEIAKLEMKELEVVKEEDDNDSEEGDDIRQLHETEIAMEKEDDEAIVEAIDAIMEADRKGELTEGDIVECNRV